MHSALQLSKHGWFATWHPYGQNYKVQRFKIGDASVQQADLSAKKTLRW